MVSAGIRDLKNRLSWYIRRLAAEKRIVITDRGHAVAELRLPETPTDDARAERYAALVANGTIRPAARRGDPLEDWPSAAELHLAPGTARSLIDEDRGDR
jgi:antitoxin (DNA-binding transcriptional repressor) of toxin-antitoxin stability system